MAVFPKKPEGAILRQPPRQKFLNIIGEADPFTIHSSLFYGHFPAGGMGTAGF